MCDPTTEELFLAFRSAQSPEAGRALVERVEPPLRTVLGAFALREADLEDTLQDSYVKLLRFACTYEAGRGFDAWFHTIARNTARDFLRKQKRNRSAQLSDELADVHGANELAQPHPNYGIPKYLVRALERLSDLEQTVIRLNCVAGISMKHVSEILEIAPKKLYPMRARALEKLRISLTDTFE